ncbi:hypothetical protein FQA47_009170 [Oryzias melastigma]|uniref:Uncharacterized protein n=1 Tax=Oryzias melastigma TaxID=30732 RepID=A0A834FLZ9_ORYME|nr:hypothetical protein FQA47_009170 [Oryzias melastigma]
MREKERRAIRKATKEFHALSIVSLFLSLKDPYSKKGYEHFYDFQSNTGFLGWRVKTVQRKFRTFSTPPKKVQLREGPTLSPTVSGTSNDQRTGDECMEAISLLQHTTSCDLVFQKMRETFQYRRQFLQDPQISADVLKIFPRFLDVKGLEQGKTCTQKQVLQERQAERQRRRKSEGSAKEGGDSSCCRGEKEVREPFRNSCPTDIAVDRSAAPKNKSGEWQKQNPSDPLRMRMVRSDEVWL